MTDYQTVAAQLARVRAAWKRAAALSGLTVVVLEAVGLFTLALVIDLLFNPGPVGRAVILAAAAVGLLVQLIRHALAPLVRRIPDRQVALFVEEHTTAFEGALIAAAEFGPTAHLDLQHQAIIEAIIREAEVRAHRFDLRAAVDLKRLKKYAILALVVFGGYGMIAAVFPDTVSRHAQRVLVPWKTPVIPVGAMVQAPVALPPITITLSQVQADILRGTKFELEATLSRDPAGPVRLHFRPLLAQAPAHEDTAADDTADAGQWHALVMDSIEKLHGYALTLPDVNEPIEFFVSAENYKSPRGQITVYDPLVIESLQLAVKYPDYLDLPDRLFSTPNGDVAAPIGSTVTFTIGTNRPLAGGLITWADGEGRPMIVSPDRPQVASVSFPVTANRSFSYRVEDVTHQVVQSPAPAFVTALVDQPPTIELVRPTGSVRLTPTGEITFEAEVADDFGAAGVDLVYRRGIVGPDTPAQRIPLTLTASQTNRTQSGAMTARGLWQLEAMTPVAGFGDVFTYYVEVRDRKGQTAATQVEAANVGLYEVWMVENWNAETHGGEPMPPEVKPLLQAVWMLHQKKPSLPPEDFNRQTEELAEAFIRPGGEAVWDLFPIMADTPRGMIPVYKKFQQMVVEAHGTLKQHDTQKTVDILQSLLTQMLALGLVDMEKYEPLITSTGTEANAFQEETQRMAQLEQELPDTPEAEPKTSADTAAAQAAKDAAEKAAAAEKQQKQIVEQAKQQSKQDASPNDRDKLAAQQQDVAEKTKKIADDLDKEAAKDKKLDQASKDLAAAAQKMNKAAQEMRTGRMEKAATEAEQAQRDLERVREQLTGLSQEKLAAVLDQAERQAQRLVNQQKDLHRKTDKLADEQKKQPQPTPAQQRDFKVLATDQAKAKGDLQELQQTVDQLAGAVQQGTVKPETAKHITDTQRNLRRGQVDQKITNAAVELARFSATGAAEQQTQAEASLDKVLKSIQAAGDSLASDYESELRRARREASQLADALEKANPAAAKKADEKAKPEQKDDGKKDQQTPAERREQAEQAADLVDRVQRHAASRQFVAPQKLEDLKEAAGDVSQLAGRIEQDEERAVKLIAAARRVHAELEQLYDEHLQAGRIFSAQREECPPQYRQLVNEYFETLSKENR